MDSVMNYSLFDRHLDILSCAYYPQIDWHVNHPPKSYWSLFWSDEPASTVISAEQKVPFDLTHGMLIPSYSSYQLHASDSMTLMYVYFEIKPELENALPRPHVITINSEMLQELKELKQMILGQGAEHWRVALLHHLVSGAILQLSKEDFSMPPQQDKRIMEALDIIERDYAQPLTIQTLCRQVNMSQNNFLRMFHEVTGQTPHSYVNYIRIRNARRMLREDDFSIKEIAELTGFANRYHFTRVFQRYTFVAPAEYRRKCTMGAQSGQVKAAFGE